MRASNQPKKPVAFPLKVGDVYVATLPELREVEIEDLMPQAQIVKLKGEGWLECTAFAAAVKGRVGRAVYRSGLMSRRRRVIREG
jgi:hypothetical protein